MFGTRLLRKTFNHRCMGEFSRIKAALEECSNSGNVCIRSLEVRQVLSLGWGSRKYRELLSD